MSFTQLRYTRRCKERRLRERQAQLDMKSAAEPKVFRQRELTDESPFPFGKWKDNQMKNVPNEYYTWFLEQSWHMSWPAVVAYAKKKLGI